MKTHALITFNKTKIKITKGQADVIGDMLANKGDIQEKDYVRLGEEVIYLNSISEVITLPYNEIVLDPIKTPLLNPGRNRYSMEDNMQRMRAAAEEAKKVEQIKWKKVI